MARGSEQARTMNPSVARPNRTSIGRVKLAGKVTPASPYAPRSRPLATQMGACGRHLAWSKVAPDADLVCGRAPCRTGLRRCCRG
jgi:hypothetical protein